MKPTRPKTPARTPAQSRFVARFGFEAAESEAVAVFCRVRPLNEDEELQEGKCVTVIDEETVQVAPPENSRYFYNGKLTNCSFKAVFDEVSSQSQVFNVAGLPLVKDLLSGRNGLLFTYGVTGSGKTHTMQGTPSDGGVMTRAIDVIFNSIENRQVSRKFIVVPDRLNDFQVQTTVDAATMQQNEMMAEMKARGGSSGNSYNSRKYNRDQNNSNSSNPNLSNRMIDDTKVHNVDNKCVYAVFISYCEIYNKFIYDLLDDSRDSVTGKPKFTSKTLREDSHGNMFVYGAKEIEVRNPKEALEAFYRGQKRRRVAETQLNHESSRSHSVFNIRLVRCAPADELEVDQTKACVVSQLALVDLAGSERTSRTGNTGERLREAGNINNSLMNLRTCIERLRDNQKSGKASSVPYRNDKMTHLFRNYFEGIGSVKMIVCVNPRASDYEETLNVLQFSEVAQEIEIERYDPIQRELAMTPARHRANQAYQEAMARAATEADTAKMNPQYAPIYSLGPAWPNFNITAFEDEEMLPGIVRYLEQRIATRNTLTEDHSEKSDQFRNRIVETEKEVILLREENQRLRAGWDGEKRRIRDMENRLVNAEAANTTLQRKVDAFCEQKVVLENELDEKELELKNQKHQSKKTVKQLKTQLSQEKEMRKRSHPQQEEEDFRGVGSRIAEMEAKITCKKYKI